MQTFDWELYRTDDGSFTLKSNTLGENYHSLHGAWSESMHVYIQHGLLNKSENEQLSVLEVGLGTGLNCLLTQLYKPIGQKISYTALEPFPLPQRLVNELLAMQENKIHLDILNKIHATEWSTPTRLADEFLLLKLQDKFQDFNASESYDIIYYDAFGAHIQAEMWNEENCMKLFNLLKNNGIVITYCAKGSFKRDMKKAGFILEPLPGPQGKREITRARKLA